MVATERAVRRARRRSVQRLSKGLPWLAAVLGLGAREARGQSSIDTRFLFYKESGGRTQVLNPVVLLHQDFGESSGAVDLTLAYDSISGASPSGGYPTLDVTTSASGHLSSSGSIPQVDYSDTRKSATLSYTKKLGANLPSIDVSYAKENDYTARSFGLSDALTFAHGRATLHAGASFSRDIVAPVTNDLRLSKNTDGYSLGLTWILGERDLVDLSGSLMKLSGYLDDPYKIVPIGAPDTTVTSPDHRPGTRSRRALVAKYGHYFSWDAALKVNYRYYWDDWSIRAHTLDVTYDHKIGSDWIVSPRVRLYVQSGAFFYGSLFAAPESYMSADYRLSPLQSILGGLTVTHKIDAEFGVSAGFTYQSQQGRDRVVPLAMAGQSGPSVKTSAADLTITTVTVGFTYSY